MRFSRVPTSIKVMSPEILLILLSIIFRIPLNQTQVGGDAAMFCWMAESILNDGSAQWLIHPASPFGLAQFSYPSFMPFLLAIVSSITGLIKLGLLQSISYIYGVLLVLAGYLVGYEFSKNRNVAVFTAFAISMNPLVVRYGQIGSFTRIQFLLLFLLLLYVFLKYASSRDLRYLALAPVFAIAGLSAHRMTLVLLLVLCAALVLTVGYTRTLSRINRQRAHFLNKYVGLFVIGLFLVGLLFIFTPVYPFKGKLLLLQHGMFISGSSSIVMLINLLIDYVAGLNPIILLCGALGLSTIALNQERSVKELFLLFFILVCAPLLADSYYTSHLLMPAVAILFAIFIVSLLSRTAHKNFYAYGVIGLVSLITVFVLFYSTPIISIAFDKERFTGDNWNMPETSQYLSKLDGDIMTDSNFISRNLMLYGERPVFPFMGPEYPVYYSPNFNDAQFSFSIPAYFNSNMYYLWKITEWQPVVPDIKYQYSTMDDIDSTSLARVFDNSIERIYKVLS